jgi:flavin reductase (DIM6/NTAB) family NADH-FMN oxidoreductase RutF
LTLIVKRKVQEIFCCKISTFRFVLYGGGAGLYQKALLRQAQGPSFFRMSSSIPPVSTQDFVQAMGLHVASVCVITTLHNNERFGLTATAVSSVCAEPPRLLVCVNKSGLTYQKIVAEGHFGVNVLDESQENIGKAFAGMMGRDFDKFSLGEWHRLVTGSPILKGVASAFDCRIAQSIDQFTHTIFIGEVLGVEYGAGRDAVVYGARKFRTLRKIVTSPADAEVESLHF